MRTFITQRARAIVALLLIATTIGVWAPAMADDRQPPVIILRSANSGNETPPPTTDPVGATEADEDPLIIVIPDNEDEADEPAPVIAEEAPAEATPTPKPAETQPGNGGGNGSIIEIDPQPVIEEGSNAPARPGRPGVIQPLAPETFCQMNIGNNPLDPSNPFSYSFSVPVANNIASFAWDFGDSNSANTRDATHTYATNGTYNITLTCTPVSGPNIVLTGRITIAAAPTASFLLAEGNAFIGNPPFTINTVNNSSGGPLTYEWKVSNSADPLAPGIQTFTTENVSFVFDQALLDANGFQTGVATFYFHLVVTNSAGLQAGASRSVVFQPPAPRATFTLTPVSGSAPLSITVTGVDLNEGPITSWEWDFGDSIGVATGPGPHTYTYLNPAPLPAGTYTITLTYTGPGGNGITQRQVGVYEPAAEVDADFSIELRGETGGGFEVCFTNLSTGPVAVSEWDFNNDGTFDLTDTTNQSEVCFIYTDFIAFPSKTVRLSVRNADGTRTSTTTRNFEIVGAPVASFNVLPGTTITWGTLIDLVDTSTGAITDWEWDFNGDGVIDSTDQNPTGVNLTQLGANPIRLTVRGPGGSSFVEAIVFVNRLELTCDFTGPLNILPTVTGNTTYTSNVGNIGGRTVTYNWTITGDSAGLPLSFTTPNISVDWASIGFGAFQVRLEASTADGSVCNVTRTVNRAWQPLDCTTTNNLPNPLYATGQDYTFTASVANVDGRALVGYRWFVDNVEVQFGPANTYVWNVPIDTTGLPRTVSIRYEAVFENGAGYVPPTSMCDDETVVTINEWPALVCNSIGGPATPIPATPDNPGRNQNYTANVTGIAGRTVEYTWTISDGTINTPNPRLDNNVANVTWNTRAGQLPPAAADDLISVEVRVINPDGTDVICNMSRNITVTIPNLQCNIPVGDQFVVVGEIEEYARSLANQFGRPIDEFEWEIEEIAPNPGVTISTVHPLSLQFLVPDAEYRIRYRVTLGAVNAPGDPNYIPGDVCPGIGWSPWLSIQVYGEGINYQCESLNLSGNATPNALGSYVYSIDMDNGLGLNLNYRWVLTDTNGVEYELANFDTDERDIVSSPPFSLAQLGPIGPDHYNLRVEVSPANPADSTHTCGNDLDLIVGRLNVLYNYTIAGGWTNSAVPVNQPICLSNASAPIPGTIDLLNYVWEVTGNPAFNSWNASGYIGQEPDPTCISFSQPGAYTIRLRGTTDSGLMTDSYELTFQVYGLQSILVNRTTTSDFALSQSFAAVGTNITGPYNWVFTRVSDNSVVATRNNQQNPANVVFPGPGTYRATVTGTGPLGATSASLEFTILATDALSARFTPSQYAGVAPMNVCFTDRSVSGTAITQWWWDFDGDGVNDLTYTTPPTGPICFTYTGEGVSYPVRLRVRNASGFEDTATNVVRTYTLLERNATFSIAPQGGGAFCFTPIVSGVIVTGWEFGDSGTAGGGLNTVCHTYGASGTYLVDMFIDDGAGNTGRITRPVVVDLSSPSAPVLAADGVCAPDTTATFTVTNTGGNMLTPDQVRILDANGNVILIAPLQLASGGSAEFSVTGYSGNVTLTTTDIVVTANTNCLTPPQLSISHACQPDGTVTFSITNGATAQQDASQPYEIRNAADALVASGTLTIAPGGTQTVTVGAPASYGALTFTSSSATQGPSTVISDTSDCVAPPQLSISQACQPDGRVIFTVSNSAPAETPANQPYEIRDAANALIASGTLSIPVGDAQQITVMPPASYGALTFTSDGGALGATTQINYTSTRCNVPPTLSISQACQPDGRVIFTITNDSPDTAASQPYEIRDAANALIASGMLSAPANGTQQITVMPPASHGALTFTSASTTGQGPTTEIDYVSTRCDIPPVLEATQQCQPDGSLRVIVTNTSPDTDADQPYQVLDADSNVVQDGTINAARNGGMQTITIAPPATYGVLTFTSTSATGQGPTTTLNFNTPRCDEPPTLTVTHTCAADGSVTFTVTNNSPDTDADQPYTITNDANVEVQSGTINAVRNGGTQDIVVSPPDSYSFLAFSSVSVTGQGVTTVISDTSDCDAPPQLSITHTCRADGTLTFIVRNDDPAETDADQPYYIVDEFGSPVAEGWLAIPVGGSQDISVSPPDSHSPLTFLSFSVSGQGVTTEIDYTATRCDIPPVLSAASQCLIDGTAQFTVTNDSPDTAANQPYQVRTAGGQLVQSGRVIVPANGSAEVLVTNRYGELTFTSASDSGQGATTEMSATSNCAQPPILSGSAICQNNTALFTIVNASLDTAANQPYTLTDGNGSLLQSGTLSVAPQSATSISYGPHTGDLILSSSGAQGATTSLSVSLTCLASGGTTIGLTPRPDLDGDGNGTIVIGGHTVFFPPMNLIPQRPDTSSVERPAWDAIGIGEAVCPDWLVYHTDITGNWELFRLGNGEGNRLAPFDVNLSQGNRAGVFSMAPTRSPDGDWIAFTSNRDSTPELENWEIYIAKVDNSVIRRVTYNTFARDIDPVWSPDGRYLVFETDRDGQWELYLFDLASGAETRLTDSPASDINAYWFPDSQRIAFQSDRDGNWQIYTLDITTLEVARISDGTSADHDPHVSFDGERIAFRSFSSPSANSQIHIMNADGSGRIAVSNPDGSATNHTWSPDDKLIAYQSDLQGDLDIYIYEVESGKTRLLTDNDIPDYAPTWLCDAPIVVFNSDVTGDPNIFNHPALPIDADPIIVERQATQMTFDPSNDIYPQNTPSEENASREGSVPPIIRLR